MCDNMQIPPNSIKCKQKFQAAGRRVQSAIVHTQAIVRTATKNKHCQECCAENNCPLVNVKSSQIDNTQLAIESDM